ncbi:MAG: hypothetical protein AAB409_03605 [Gemmatimonadota bacterium]
MTSVRLWRLAGLPLVLGACTACTRPVPARVITSIGITVVPAGGGQAHAAFFPDGLVRGGHLSGDPVPFVHQDEDRLDSATAAALWTAARALGDTLLGADVPPDSTLRGYVMHKVAFDSGPPMRLTWASGAEHADARVRALVALLMENRTGGW